MLTITVLAACGSVTLPPMEQFVAQTQTSMPLLTVQQATTETQTIRTPVSITLTSDPCISEPIELTGTILFVFHFSQDANGGFHSSLLTQAQGIGGVGLISGSKYRFVGTSKNNFNGTFDPFNPGPMESTMINHFRIIGQGAAPNSHLVSRSHITINANGTLTVINTSSSLECR